MAHTRWFDPLLAFLAEQPPETTSVTRTLAELEALAGRPLPASTVSRPYWRQQQPGGMGRRLAARGWRAGSFGRGHALAITFVRLPPDAPGDM